MHPRVILGVSARQIREKLQYGTSIDWTLANNISLYANVYQTEDHGTGLDLQSLYNYGSGSLVISHNRSWLDTTDTLRNPAGRHPGASAQCVQRARPATHRWRSTIGSAVKVRSTPGCPTARAMSKASAWIWAGPSAPCCLAAMPTGGLSLFDRPGSFSSGDARNRGVDLSINLALGAPGQQITGSIGTRTARDGGRDNNASLGWRKDLKDHVLQNVSVTALTDTYGVGLSSLANFRTDAINGDGFVQRSSYNGNFTGGLNLDSTLVVGGQQMLMTSQHQRARRRDDRRCGVGHR